jgi:hypothetical protein
MERVDGLQAHLRTTPIGHLDDAVAYSLVHCLAAAHIGVKLAKVSYGATYGLKMSPEAILVLLRNGLCRKWCARPAKSLLCSPCAYWVGPF